MASALHTPYQKGQADRVGPKLFRKQILPVGEIEHDGETLSFTREYLDGLVKNFSAGTFDQVPVLLANEDNEHHSDPEKFRGDVTALEATDDGLYGVIELTDEGAKLIESNPKLGVSARIIRGIEQGKDALQHVLGTLDPKVTGMKPWESVSLSKHKDAEVVDLTGESFSDAVAKDLSDAEQKQLAALLKKGGKDAATAALKDTDLSDEEVERTIAQILDEAEADTSTETDKDKEPVAALSEKQRKAIELAESRATSAESRVSDLEKSIAQDRFERKRDELVEAGVPPIMVELAEPVLRGGSGTIELSNGTKVNAHNVVDKMLAECKGLIDLTTVGVGSGAEGSQEAEAKEAAEAWAKQQGGS